MLFIPPCARHLRSVKTELSLNLPHVGSSHLSEAIAFACGYKTNAALRTQLWEPDTPPSEAATLTFNATAFESRLAVMGYELGPYFSGLEAFASKCWVSDTYRNARELAGRNLIVAAVLSGLTQNLFTLDAGDNRWPGASSRKPFKFHVWLPGSIPVTASVEDIGMGELSLSVSVKPTKGFIDGFAKGLQAGDGYVQGWLERQNGKWIMSDSSGGMTLNFKQSVAAQFALMTAPALGFADHGKFIM